jgi:hypothetical protein
MIMPASALGAAESGVPTYSRDNGPDDLQQTVAVQGEASAESDYGLPAFYLREIIGQYASNEAATTQYAQARRKLSGDCGDADGLPAKPEEPVTVTALGDEAMEWPDTVNSDRAETFATTTVVIRQGRYLIALWFEKSGQPPSPPPAVPASQVTSISRLAVTRIPG